MPPKRKLTIDDLCSIRQVSSPQISPDGSHILFAVTEPRTSENKYVTHIYLANQNGVYHQLTNKGSDNHSPVWSPTGHRIALFSDMDGTQGLWTCSPFEDETLVKLVSVGENPVSPLWSPDCKRILFLSRTTQGDPQTSDVLVIKTLPYKFDTYGFLNNKWSHIFIVDERSGELTQITEGEFSVTAAVWDRSGNKIAYLAGKGERREFSYWNDVWVMDLRNQEHLKITDGERYFNSLSFSPNGRFLSYIGRKRNYGLRARQTYTFSI